VRKRPPYDYNDLSVLLTNLGRENLGHTLP
jgi:hypothetical protein